MQIKFKSEEARIQLSKVSKAHQVFANVIGSHTWEAIEVPNGFTLNVAGLTVVIRGEHVNLFDIK